MENPENQKGEKSPVPQRPGEPYRPSPTMQRLQKAIKEPQFRENLRSIMPMARRVGAQIAATKVPPSKPPKLEPEKTLDSQPKGEPMTPNNSVVILYLDNRLRSSDGETPRVLRRVLRTELAKFYDDLKPHLASGEVMLGCEVPESEVYRMIVGYPIPPERLFLGSTFMKSECGQWVENILPPRISKTADKPAE